MTPPPAESTAVTVTGKHTYEEFFSDVLRKLAAHTAAIPLRALAVVSITEGENDYWNPLNSVIPQKGSNDFNNQGVQRYPNFDVGVAGTVALLEQPRWKWAVQALRCAHGRDLILRQFEVEYATWGAHPKFYDVTTAAADHRLAMVMPT